MRGLSPLCYNIVVAVSTISPQQNETSRRDHEHDIDPQHKRREFHIHA